MGTIYFDHNASTPVADEVVAAMQPFLSGHWGNPSSGHWASVGAAAALTRAREQVASLLGATADTVVFQSGASEANNHVIKGCALRHLRVHPGSHPHIVISSIEHSSVRRPCRWLETLGARVTEVPVDGHGRIDPERVAATISDDTVLVSIMHANNEIGTLQPIAEVAAIARERGVLMHTDAAQSVGKVATKVDELGVDMLSVAGHKLYAPKGIGALYLRSGVELDPLVHGAGHEQGRRSGTENVLLAVGLGAACALAEHDPCTDRLTELRDRFWHELREAFGDGVVLNGHPIERLPNTVNVSFVGHISPDILAKLDGVAASTGAACHAGSRTMSSVLTAMGVAEDVGLGAIRFSLGRATTVSEIEAVVTMLRRVV